MSKASPQPLAQALRSLQSGDLPGAERLLKRVLLQHPAHGDALHLMGVVKAMSGAHREAVALYRKALRTSENNVELRTNLALALAELGEFDAALREAEAVAARKPDSADIHCLHGNLLKELGRNAEALTSYERAVALDSASVQAWCNRGVVLTELAKLDEALASYGRALAIDSNSAEVWSNRGNTLSEMKRYSAALASYERALAIDPQHADAWANRGVALDHLRRYEEALASYDRALAADAHNARAWANRGSALNDLKRHAEAARSYEHALRIAPEYEFAKGELLYSKMLACEWAGLDALLADIESDIARGARSAEPFSYQALCNSEASLRRCAEIYSQAYFPPQRHLQRPPHRQGKLRLGYVSGEFRHQATAILIAQLFELHDKSQFEIYAFDNGWDDGSHLRRRMQAAFDAMLDISGLTDAQAAAAVIQHGIDILINLNGFFGLHRQGVFSSRPAPVQVNYLGWPGTLGVDYMDYIIADRFVIPRGHEAHYAEKVVRLPDSYQVNDGQRKTADLCPMRIELGLPERGFVFCCFNNNYKITPAMFALWMRVLARVPNSVLWLIEDTSAASGNLKSEAQKHGIDPQRLVFAPRVDLEQHLARHRQADLFLDTVPYNAHTTGSDALWAGLPVLTCTGTTFPGRVATSLLHAAELPELAASNVKEYERLAIQLATEPDTLAALRRRLESRRSQCALFDAARFARHIEAAYWCMWQRVEQGLAPDHIEIAASG